MQTHLSWFMYHYSNRSIPTKNVFCYPVIMVKHIWIVKLCICKHIFHSSESSPGVVFITFCFVFNWDAVFSRYQGLQNKHIRLINTDENCNQNLAREYVNIVMSVICGINTKCTCHSRTLLLRQTRRSPHLFFLKSWVIPPKRIQMG